MHVGMGWGWGGGCRVCIHTDYLCISKALQQNETTLSSSMLLHMYVRTHLEAFSTALVKELKVLCKYIHVQVI